MTRIPATAPNCRHCSTALSRPQRVAPGPRRALAGLVQGGLVQGGLVQGGLVQGGLVQGGLVQGGLALALAGRARGLGRSRNCGTGSRTGCTSGRRGCAAWSPRGRTG
jgi:hypothetical protein